MFFILTKLSNIFHPTFWDLDPFSFFHVILKLSFIVAILLFHFPLYLFSFFKFTNKFIIFCDFLALAIEESIFKLANIFVAISINELSFSMGLEILIKISHISRSFFEYLNVHLMLENRIVLELTLNCIFSIFAKEVKDTISMSLTHLLIGEEPMFPLTFRRKSNSSPNWFS